MFCLDQTSVSASAVIQKLGSDEGFLTHPRIITENKQITDNTYEQTSKNTTNTGEKKTPVEP